NRHYHSNIAAFLGRDRIRLGVPNLYCYTDNSPINATDPYGLIGIFFDGAGQQAGAGTVLQSLFAKYNGNAYMYFTNIWPNNIWANINAAYRRVCDAICKTVIINCRKLTHQICP